MDYKKSVKINNYQFSFIIKKKIKNMINLLLKIRYILFKRFCKKVNFSKRKLVFSDDFKTLDNFTIREGFYNQNSVWFQKECISLSNDGLVIQCKEDNKYHESWDGARVTKWKSGLVDTREKFEFSKGLWVIEAKFNGGWPAIWLLKVGHIPTGFEKDKIIPEVDIMETIHGKFRQTVHWGYSETQYRLYETGHNICKYDTDFHTFAVDLLDNGYNFYIDGILTSRFRNNNSEFVSNEKNYLLLNSANDVDTSDQSDVVFRSVRVYE